MDRQACILFSCDWFLTLHPAFPSLADMSQSLTIHTGPILLPISSCLSRKPWRMPPLKDLPAHTLFSSNIHLNSHGSPSLNQVVCWTLRLKASASNGLVFREFSPRVSVQALVPYS